MVEYLPSKYEVLHPNPSMREREEEGKEEGLEREREKREILDLALIPVSHRCTRIVL
jgi:hypothetical protein